jgi:transposase
MAWKRLTDDEWGYIEPHIPQQGRGRPRKNDREIMDAILFILSTNIRWSEFPPGFPPKSTVFDRFKVWVKAGFFKKLPSLLRRELPKPRTYHLDSTIKSSKKGRSDFTSWQDQGQQDFTGGRRKQLTS